MMVVILWFDWFVGFTTSQHLVGYLMPNLGFGTIFDFDRQSCMKREKRHRMVKRKKNRKIKKITMKRIDKEGGKEREMK